jgi:flagellar motor protein MotB
MKTSLMILALVTGVLHYGWSQGSQPVLVNLQVMNQLTGTPVDATLSWYDDQGVKKVSAGKYQVTLGAGREETLTITRDGYFDSQLKLDYETVKASPDVEVQLQPGIPQLHISILSQETGETLRSAIDLFTMDESSIVFSEEVEVSPYTIDLEYDKVHVLQVRCPGYFSFKDTINFSGVFDGRVREKKIGLVRLKAGNKISLNNIYFEQNEASLTDFAKLMLAELTHILESQQNIVIEIGAYTDDVGSNEYNKALSEKRAVAVKKYLLEKGAKEQQLLAKGYGEANPVTPNNSDQSRALNRRVEFRIISIN